MGFSGDGAVRAMKAGDYQATIFPGTQIGIQGALDYAGVGGRVDLGPGSFTGITNLTMYAKTMLSGCGAQATNLLRAGSATGIGIREKTAGEGNPSGATGIIVRDLSLFANGSSGDGIDFGNQGGALFSSNAALIDILVRDFTSGIGINLAAQAIHTRNVWVASCGTGAIITSGGSHFDGWWIEHCSSYNLRVQSGYNTFSHLHMETGANTPTYMIYCETVGKNLFLGVELFVESAVSKLVGISGGANNFVNLEAISGVGGSWTHTIWFEAWNNGTGVVGAMPFFFDAPSGYNGKAFLQDITVSEYQVISTGTGGLQAARKGTDLTAASTITADQSLTGGSFFVVNGNTTINNITNNARYSGRIIRLQTSGTPTISHNAGGTGNIRLVGSVDVAMTANDIITLVSDGTLWWQCAPVAVI